MREVETDHLPVSRGRKSRATGLSSPTLENKSQPLVLACQSSSSLILTVIHFSDLVPAFKLCPGQRSEVAMAYNTAHWGLQIWRLGIRLDAATSQHDSLGQVSEPLWTSVSFFPYSFIMMKYTESYHLNCQVYASIVLSMFLLWCKRHHHLSPQLFFYLFLIMLCSFASVVSNSATPWTVARQASLSVGFSRQE